MRARGGDGRGSYPEDRYANLFPRERETVGGKGNKKAIADIIVNGGCLLKSKNKGEEGKKGAQSHHRGSGGAGKRQKAGGGWREEGMQDRLVSPETY